MADFDVAASSPRPTCECKDNDDEKTVVLPIMKDEATQLAPITPCENSDDEATDEDSLPCTSALEPDLPRRGSLGEMAANLHPSCEEVAGNSLSSKLGGEEQATPPGSCDVLACTDVPKESENVISSDSEASDSDTTPSSSPFTDTDDKETPPCRNDEAREVGETVSPRCKNEESTSTAQSESEITEEARTTTEQSDQTCFSSKEAFAILAEASITGGAAMSKQMGPIEILAREILTAAPSKLGSLGEIHNAITEFLACVLEGLGKIHKHMVMFSEVQNFLLEYLLEKFEGKVQEWITGSLENGLASAFSEEDRKSVCSSCSNDKEMMNRLDNLVTKIAVRESTKLVGKEAARTTVKQAAKEGVKQVAKQTAKTATQQATKHGAKHLAKIVSKGATPWSVIPDVAQVGLEVTGHETAGKAVGATGNIAFGAVAGAVVGGPVGAVIGGAIGGGVWVVGEGAGQVIDWLWSSS